MNLISQKAILNGSVRIPASKSHTIRALIISTLAEGQSVLINPLQSGDTISCLEACRAFGAEIIEEENKWIVNGKGVANPPTEIIDVGNSGTSLYLLLSAAALIPGESTFTGDYQIKRRSAQSLIDSLNDLGAKCVSTRGNGCAPFVVRGKLKGGLTTIECPTSQYLSSLLISCPLAEGGTEISVPLLNEKPYVEMTLDWLKNQNIKFENLDFKKFVIPGNQKYKPFSREIPADFSSATFFLVAAAITGGNVTLNGLDMNDTQGDKAVVEMLKKMGAEIEIGENFIRVNGGQLIGAELDLNATPDALPAMAVAGCFAKGETRLVNVPQAREKETDRISVMCKELKNLGADIEEMPDGLIIRESKLKGGNAHGYDDHRVVMSLAVAGLCSENPINIDTAESAGITFPNFVELMNSIGGKVT
ncbi:3-phosphoshikimate 1-carboxyvinyltransferase [bacterium]|nr:3-phosphoshikimate 1-carboxyvinyltransferase [bacterium]